MPCIVRSTRSSISTCATGWSITSPSSRSARKFDRYVQALGEVAADTLKSWPPDRQLAYWINAYNAFVLRTVIDGYPIRGKVARLSGRTASGRFPARSSAGTFRAGGRTLTLDAIEKDVIGEFGDARALLALGRGAIGGPRLKSEAFTADAARFAAADHGQRARDAPRSGVRRCRERRLSVNPLFSWREADFHEVARRTRAGGLRERAARSSAACWR